MRSTNSLDVRCINTIRTLSIDAVQRANSGHPGMPMGAAPMAYMLWTRFLKHNPADPQWFDRDRFVLSAGHGSMLLYSLLHLTGYELALDEIKNFRQLGSETPGHPEVGHTAGVETTTGPLGQGFGNGVGMAIAEAHLAATFNRPGFEIVNHYTYGIVSDGDLMEGVASEAASLAGHLRLGKLIYLYDDNNITIDGNTELTFTEDRARRFEAYGWHVQSVEDGNDLAALETALIRAREEKGRPSIICVRTVIGYGSPNRAGSEKAHGEPLGEEEVALTKKELQWQATEPFYIPDDVLRHMRSARERGEAAQQRWQQHFEAYAKEHPELAQRLTLALQRELPPDWDTELPRFKPDAKGMATRASGGKVLNALAQRVPELIGGSADLLSSTKVLLEQSGVFAPGAYQHRNIYFGVREHAMGSICNGIALHGALRPYCSTFLIFSDYMRPAIRLAALMQQPVIYVFTHDSIGLGEDGPTHQPVEHYAALRAIPNLTFIRPCDANEVAVAWQVALRHKDGPVALALSRQNVPTLDRSKYGPAAGLEQGAYVLLDPPEEIPALILIASGSELWPTLQAGEELLRRGIPTRVVSMPSWELFEAQATAYRKKVLLPGTKARLAVEAGVSLGWERYIGEEGATVTIDGRYGASGPSAQVMAHYGFTVENIVERALELL